MAATELHEQDMKKKCEREMNNTKDPIEKLRLKCLARGASGIKGLSRYVYELRHLQISLL